MQIAVWMLILILFAASVIMAWDAYIEERRRKRALNGSKHSE